jgi:hypothetical protein
MGSTYNILKITRKARTPFLEYLRKKLRWVH